MTHSQDSDDKSQKFYSGFINKMQKVVSDEFDALHFKYSKKLCADGFVSAVEVFSESLIRHALLISQYDQKHMIAECRDLRRVVRDNYFIANDEKNQKTYLEFFNEMDEVVAKELDVLFLEYSKKFPKIWFVGAVEAITKDLIRRAQIIRPNDQEDVMAEFREHGANEQAAHTMANLFIELQLLFWEYAHSDLLTDDQLLYAARHFYHWEVDVFERVKANRK